MVVDELLLLLLCHALQRVVFPLELARQAVEGWWGATGRRGQQPALQVGCRGPGHPTLLSLRGLGLDPVEVLKVSKPKFMTSPQKEHAPPLSAQAWEHPHHVLKTKNMDSPLPATNSQSICGQ